MLAGVWFIKIHSSVLSLNSYVGTKQLCVLAHPSCTHKAGTSVFKILKDEIQLNETKYKKLVAIHPASNFAYG